MRAKGKRIVISTFGSFGDVHPYIAIALELKRRGHAPVIATSGAYREKIEPLGFELSSVRPDMPSFDEPEKVAAIVEHVVDERAGPERLLNTLVMPHLRESFDDLSEAVRGADLLLTHPLPFVGPLVAEKTGVRWVSSVLAPSSFFSIYDPPVPPQMPSIHGLIKRSPLLTRVLLKLARVKARKTVAPVYALRASLGLSPDGHPIFEGQHSPLRVLALFSKVLAKPQRDWPKRTLLTGFPFYDKRDRAGDPEGLSPEIVKYLDAGDAPVVFTLGSSAFWAAKDFYTESVKAAEALGVRALLLIGDERNRPAKLPEGVEAFEYAPFGELLPRSRAVVHQGGVGTTGQTLRSGRPALIVPHAFDQHDNAARAERLGTSRTLRRKHYDGVSAAGELKELLGDESYSRRAEETGLTVRAEDGAGAACDAIEEVLV